MKFKGEEDYLASKGFGISGFGELAMHKGLQKTKRQQDKLVALQLGKNSEFMQRREELRQEYSEKLSRGEIQEFTAIEKLLFTANGHPDNESTKAARRALIKRGIIIND